MKVNNVELNIRTLGNGVPFLWGHGLMASMSLDDSTGFWQWDNLTKITKLIRYDARGHGLSEGTYNPEDYHWANLAKDMIGVANELGVDQFVAGGQSMGCMTSLYAALAFPERIRAVVLVNPGTAWETRAAQSAIYGQAASLVETLGIKALVGVLHERPLFPPWLMEARPQVGEQYLACVQSMDEKVLPKILLGASLCDLPPRDHLKTVLIPALILAWPDDHIHPVEMAEDLNRLLPQSQLVFAKDVNDLLGWPEAISRFIAGLS